MQRVIFDYYIIRLKKAQANKVYIEKKVLACRTLFGIKRNVVEKN